MDVARAIGDSIERAPWGWALLATVFIAVVKVWPILAQQAIEARAKLRQENRSDISDCQRRLDEMRTEMDSVKAAMHHLEMKLVGALGAYRILDIEVESIAPGSTALGQARAVMSAAFTISPSTPPDGASPPIEPEKAH